MKRRAKKIGRAALVIGFLGIGAGLGYWHYQTPLIMPSPRPENPNSSLPYRLSISKKAPFPVPYVLTTPKPTEQESIKGTGSLKSPEPLITPPVPVVPLPDLNQSDAFVRKRIKDLSPAPQWMDWIKIGNIIRVITATVDNVALGDSPRPHLPFLKPGRSFSVIVKRDKIILDPDSYKRYDRVADIFASLNTRGIIQMYLALKPLFRQAYRDLGYPDRDFQEALKEAMGTLLSTPIVKGDITLTEARKGINYLMEDEFLENLNQAQKHLLRMGPENTLKIQKKIREMASGLGVPEKNLPGGQTYEPRNSP